MKDVKPYSRSRFPTEVVIPWGQRDLIYTDHALSRMRERTQGDLSILPHMVLLSEKNLKQIWVDTSQEPLKIKSMKMEVPYTRGTLLQLIASYDEPSGKLIVITLYFREVWRKTIARHAGLLPLESTASDTNPDSPLVEQPELDATGQVVFPLGTYFPKGQYLRRS